MLLFSRRYASELNQMKLQIVNRRTGISNLVNTVSTCHLFIELKYIIDLYYTSKHGIIPPKMLGNHTQAGGSAIAGVGLGVMGEFIHSIQSFHFLFYPSIPAPIRV
jgi:hypothetical protein